MLFDHQNRPHILGARVANVVFVLLVLAGLGYAISTQSENTQFGTELLGVSSARAVQQETPPAIEYFPAGYVNQARAVEEHIQAF